MKIPQFITRTINAVCVPALFAALLLAVPSPRLAAEESTLFNDNWRFQKDEPAEFEKQLDYSVLKPWLLQAAGVKASAKSTPAAPVTAPPVDMVPLVRNDYDDSKWRTLSLPHDWGIEGPFNINYPADTGKLPWWGVGWYRKHFQVSREDRGKSVFLDIDGAMALSTVWLNGHMVGGWPYGFTSYRLDLTPYLKYGEENVLSVRLNNLKKSSRWYPGGGIYRNVWLVKSSPVHVAHWGTFITTPEITDNEATVHIAVSVQNQTAQQANTTIAAEIHELGVTGNAIASSAVPVEVPANAQQQGEITLKVPHPKLWDLQTPNLYEAVVTVKAGAATLDIHRTTFGIRTSRFDADKGYFLNGKHVKIQGVCDHHDLGALGAAINVRALERQIEILKEMGCNAIRTSHNPPAPELLELCDRMGMLVMDEAFDCWGAGKNPNDYSRYFWDWHDADLRALVRRDRNHPCVILWSTGNEISEQGWGFDLSRQLTQIVHEEDSTRYVTAACSYNEAGFNGFQNTLDVMGYNYKPGSYDSFHKKNPAIPIFGSETASCISSRGEYFFPVNENQGGGKADFQVSSYDLSAPGWASPPDLEFKSQDKFDFVAGEFVWTGFDYLGEPTPYNADPTNLMNFTDPAEKEKMAKELADLGKIKSPSRSSYFGIVDLCGFKKDRFYLYQAKWRPDFAMAHILPHWNWPDRVGQVTPVFVYTSGDEAELFLNGKSLGRKKKEPLSYRLRWNDVQYEPGELHVVAYKDGKQWAEDTVRTTDVASQVIEKADRSTIKADGNDLSYITISITDGKNQTVPTANDPISFTISGPGEIVATDNGDSTSLVSFQSPERNAFNGLCLVIVRSKAGQAGEIKVSATSGNLKAGEAVIQAVSADGEKNIQQH